jgi:hypothetical protein
VFSYDTHADYSVSREFVTRLFQRGEHCANTVLEKDSSNQVSAGQ